MIDPEKEGPPTAYQAGVGMGGVRQFAFSVMEDGRIMALVYEKLPDGRVQVHRDGHVIIAREDFDQAMQKWQQWWANEKAHPLCDRWQLDGDGNWLRVVDR